MSNYYWNPIKIIELGRKLGADGPTAEEIEVAVINLGPCKCASDKVEAMREAYRNGTAVTFTRYAVPLACFSSYAHIPKSQFVKATAG